MFFILAVMFWALCAVAVVGMLAYIYCQVQYYKWDKEDRMQNNLVNKISEKIVDEMTNSGGN